jgi:osmotically inducible protein OsmC
MSIQVKYHTTATATGGRDGRAHTQDGSLDVKLATPKELGGTGAEGTNPEQLFAAGYAACFLSALKLVGQQLKVQVPGEALVTADVGIGMRAEGGFGLAVELTVNLPGIDRADAERLVETAHQVCPYSNATRNNVDVTLTIA